MGDVFTFCRSQRNTITYEDFTLGTKVAGSGEHINKPTLISDGTSWNASRPQDHCNMIVDGRKKLNVGLSTEVTIV
jgi:hypothetical protein